MKAAKFFGLAAAGAMAWGAAAQEASVWGISVERAGDPSLLPVIEATLPQNAEGLLAEYQTTAETNVTKTLKKVELEESVEPWRGWQEVRFTYRSLRVMKTWTPGGEYPSSAVVTNTTPVKGVTTSYRLKATVEVGLSYAGEDGTPKSETLTLTDATEAATIRTPHVRLVEGEAGAISVRRSDWTNYWPVAEIAPPAGWTEASVETAPTADGPWTAGKTWVAGEAGQGVMAWTNESALVGVNMHYRLKSSIAPSGPEAGTAAETATVPVAFRRLRLLERDWSDMTKLREGIDIIPPSNIEATNTVKRLFDNDETTHANVLHKTINFAGLDFNETVHLGAYRYFIANLGFEGHNKHTVWGGEDSGFSGAPVAICNKWTQPNCEYPIMGEWVDEERIDDAVAQNNYRCVKVTYGGTVIYNSELQFYGWTEADEAGAGLPVMTKSISVARGADGVTVSWEAGQACTEYRIERRTPANESGAEVWTLVGTTGECSFTDAEGAELASLYRVSGWNANHQAGSYSDMKFHYPPANGGGLHARICAPFTNSSPDIAQVRYSETRTVANPSAGAYAAGESISGAAEEPCTSLVRMKGTLLVPAPGKYEFRLRGDMRMAAFLDGWQLADRWSASGYGNATVKKEFKEAGEHAFELTVNDLDAMKAREYNLEWSYEGGEFEAIHGGQFAPAEEAVSDELGEWTGGRVTLPNWGLAETNAAENSFRFLSGSDANGKGNFPAVYRAAEGEFELEAQVDHTQIGNGCRLALFARDESGNVASVSTYHRNGNFPVTFFEGETAVDLGHPENVSGKDDIAKMWLKLVREGNGFKCFAKWKQADEWQLMHEYAPERRLPRRLYVGAGGATQWGYANVKKYPQVHGLRYKPIRRGFQIIFR